MNRPPIEKIRDGIFTTEEVHALCDYAKGLEEKERKATGIMLEILERLDSMIASLGGADG